MATEEETREAAEESLEIGGEDDATGSGHGGEAEEGMTPWEQHAAVINLPRYDYSAPSSLLHEPRSGFLITCPISEPFPILFLFCARYTRQNPWLRFNVRKVPQRKPFPFLKRSVSVWLSHPCLNSCDILQFVSRTSRSIETSSTDTPAKKRKLSTEVDPENAESEEKNGVDSVLEASGMG
ncbi:hypothetical protein GW17_00047784 [Ensete ventricosum]|nr:hypothetical protein GW17_00047784 [Ensete ventricosum]